MKRIFFVEDDLSLIGGLSFALRKQGYEIDIARTSMEAESLWQNGIYDLVILDVSLPDGSGYDLCRKIRETSRVPVMFLTAADEETDIIMGLDIGGDDYITKPFAIEELLARIRVVFKKRGGLAQRTRKMTVKGVTIDTDRYEVTCGGELVELNHREYELVRILMENKNIVMNRQQLMNSVCGYDYMGETNIIDVYVRHIRSKIDDRFGFRFITTVRGVGYAVKEE